MSKLRRNHSQQSASTSGGMVTKVGIFAALLGGLYFLFNQFSGESPVEPAPTEEKDEVILYDPEPSETIEIIPPIFDNFIPSSTTGEIIKHDHFALSYAEKHEQAEWVAYELTVEMLNADRVARMNNFRPDPKVRKASASPRDYVNTGYNRGHLVPASDMGFSKESMSESFYMSNISPQIRNFNSGIWRELEEQTRDWARKFKHLYVITGPILSEAVREQIGQNKVSVPDQYYKILLDITEPELKAIAFLIPNEVRVEPILKFAVSIDVIENLTGIDFFPQLEDKLEEKLEEDVVTKPWKTSQKRYELRVDEWNKVK